MYGGRLRWVEKKIPRHPLFSGSSEFDFFEDTGMPEVLVATEQYGQVLEILDGLGCGLVSTDADGVIGYINERLAGWLQYDKAELEGMHDAELIPSELRDLFLEDAHQNEGPDLRVRLLALQRKDFTTLPVLVFPQHYYDENGEIDRWVSVIVDLGAVQTARHIGYHGHSDLRATLQRIAIELQGASLAADSSGAVLLPLDHPDFENVSPREREVLSMLVSGSRVPAIASELHISPHTVRNHLKSIYRKIGVQTQSELIERVRELSTE